MLLQYLNLKIYVIFALRSFFEFFLIFLLVITQSWCYNIAKFIQMPPPFEVNYMETERESGSSNESDRKNVRPNKNEPDN